MKKWIFWLAALILLAALQASLRGLIGAYNYQIVILVGINIILAVSLNLINGVTGQFSIGHAGFYAVGGYTSASLVYYGGKSIRALTGFMPAMAQDAILLVIGLSAAALAAGLAGLAVGIPSLRLRGDYTMYLHPNSFLFTTSFYLIIMIVVGGLGSIEGSILGAILVTVSLEVFRSFGPFRLVNFAILLILIMIYRPQGLVGKRHG